MQRTVFILAWLAVGPAAFAGYLQDAAPSSNADPLHPRVKMETSLGDIVLELDAQHAPLTTINFIQYVKDKFYDGTVFHRVMSTFMIQGGGFTAEMDKKTDGLRGGVKNEWQNGLKNVKGSIAMARLGGQPDSATAQFFINVVDNKSLDKARDGAAYAVFGKVVDGMDTIEKIRTTPVAPHPKYSGGRAPTVPVTPVIIKTCRLISVFDEAKAKVAAENAGKEAAEAKARADAEANAGKDELVKRFAQIKASATKTDSGLKYYDEVVGGGITPLATDQVEVHYTGWLTDGTKFDSSRDAKQGFPNGRTFTFSLKGGVIKGWLEGVATMHVGGKRTLIIPPELAYGAPGRGRLIPPNSTLIFDIELLSIK